MLTRKERHGINVLGCDVIPSIISKVMRRMVWAMKLSTFYTYKPLSPSLPSSRSLLSWIRQVSGNWEKIRKKNIDK